jgi:cytochrome c-type biogenesis protein CcmE
MVQPFAWAAWWSWLTAAQRRRNAAAFMVTDGAQCACAVPGLLPDLFREGKGVVVSGRMQADGAFQAPRCWPSTTRTTCRPKPRTPRRKQAQPAKEQP